MKISIEWIKDFVRFDEPPAVLARDLAMLGLPVDGFEPVAEDWVFDIDVTANRPDCLNHIGIARELAARYGEPLALPRTELLDVPPTTEVPVAIEIADPDLCPRYCGMVLRGLHVGPSPIWLQERLLAVGQRPINNLVDITNYVLMEMGHPLHAFDYRKLKNGRIIVRRARENESIVSLDGQKRSLTPGMLLIAGEDRPVAIAGIMGGADSEVDEQTVDVLLESAWFLPASIRQTARALGMNTEASYRFERGADPEILPRALLRAAWLMTCLAGGKAASPLIDAHPVEAELRVIPLRRQRLQALIGAPVPDHFVEGLLPRLGFRHDHSDDGWTVAAPSHRPDLTMEVDVIEEVARFFGYDNVPPALPNMAGNPVERRFARPRELVRSLLRASGFQEITTTSFTDPQKDALYNFFPAEGFVRVDNPGDEAEPALRTNLSHRMLSTLKFNENNFNREVQLFEIASVYRRVGGEYRESLRLALGLFGHFTEGHWTKPSGEPWSFFNLKGILECLAEELGVHLAMVSDEIGHSGFLQPGNRATVVSGDKTLGFLGRLDDRKAAEWKFKQPVFLAEIELETLFGQIPDRLVLTPIPRFPPIVRDVSFTVDISVPFGRIESLAAGLKIEELKSLEPVEIYRGREIPEGRYAMTVRLVFQKREATLTDAEADQLRRRFSGALEHGLGAVMR